MCNFLSIIISYPRFAATSPYSKKEKSLFHRYFSFSDKSFLPCSIHYEWTATPYNSDQSKILSSIMLFIWPQLLKIWPQLSPGWPQLFSFGKRDGDNFFRARANPDHEDLSMKQERSQCLELFLL